MTREDIREHAAIAVLARIQEPQFELSEERAADYAVRYADALVARLRQIRSCIFCAHCRKQEYSFRWYSTFSCERHNLNVKPGMSCEQWQEQPKTEAKA
jgi:hypothetical protein